MTATAKQTSSTRHLLLASDRSDQSSELASILRTVGEVDILPTADIPEKPDGRFSGVVVDINLRSPQSVQRVRNKLRNEAYSNVPRLFVLADALHHASMQAWALGATDTIARPFDPEDVLQRIRAAFPDSDIYDASDRGKTLNAGVAAAHEVMVKMFERLPAGEPLKLDDVIAAEKKILRAIKHSSLREWLTAVGCHDVDKAFVSREILDKQGKLTVEEINELRQHPQRGHEALSAQGGFPLEMLDVVLHHHEFLDGSGYPHGLRAEQVTDIVRLITIVDVYSALVERRAYRLPFSRERAFTIMESMGSKLDQQL